MDPNNLAVNSVISSYLTSSLAEDERLRAAVLLALDEMCRDNPTEFQRDMHFKVLANWNSISFWYRLGVHDERLERV